MNLIAIVCVITLGLLLFGLGILVSITRAITGKMNGVNPDSTNFLHRANRAHGNTAEFVPYLGLLMLYLGANNPEKWVVWLMVIATISRFIFVAGLLFYPSMSKLNFLRFFGAFGTYVAGVGLCVAAILAL